MTVRTIRDDPHRSIFHTVIVASKVLAKRTKDLVMRFGASA